jgi:putative nucleotidyltransferase with HDIG domain
MIGAAIIEHLAALRHGRAALHHVGVKCLRKLLDQVLVPRPHHGVLAVEGVEKRSRVFGAVLTEHAAREVFKSRDPAVARAFRGIWEHCVAVGTLGRSLARGSEAHPEEVYLAGLLHDVGKPLVGALLLDAERQLLRKLGVPVMGESLWMRIVDDCHAEVGVALAHRWQLPAAVAAVVGQPHDPAGPPDAIASWLGYAHLLAESRGYTGGVAAGADIEERLATARALRGGSVEKEAAAVEALLEALGARLATVRTLKSARRA